MKPAVVAEMAFTGRAVKASEAKEIGLVNAHFPSREKMMEEVLNIAHQIASKSPVSIRGTKEVLRNARDHSVPEGLEFIARWNAGKLLSDDLTEAFNATLEKRKPVFKN
jgi:enoyl-CoA hydratase